MWTSRKRARYDRSKLRYPSDMTDEVDTLGLLLHAVVHPANVQDRDGAILVMATLFGMFPFFKSYSPTAAIRDRNSAPRWPKFARI
jgi:hypothetical protein